LIIQYCSWPILKAIGLMLGCILLCATPVALSSAQRKLHLIETNQWPGRAISFTSQELVALGMSEIEHEVPGVINQPSLRLEQDGATANVIVDFDRLRALQPQGSSTHDWLMSKLLTGRKPVEVSVKVASGDGQMSIHPTSVSISGLALSGSALDFLVENLFLPHYPDAVVNRPFALPANISKIHVSPAAALVYRR
jgi:hypothetical protein